MADIQQVKQAAQGRWPEILVSFGFRPEDLTGRNGPCPKCDGRDRFRFIDADCGAVLCNQCFREGNGDGIAAIGWYRGWEFPETMKELAGYLGITDEPWKQDADMVAAIATRKRMPLESFRSFGAYQADRDGTPVARVPMFDANLEECSYFDMSTANEKLMKGMCAKDRSAGMFVVISDPPRPGDEILITEGVKDASAAHAQGFKIVGINGAELAAKFARLFTGCAVVIVPDRDETGEAKARLTAGRLFNVAKSVRIASLPGVCKPKDGDGIREVLAMKDGATLFRAAISSAVEWTPSGEKRRPTVVRLLDAVHQVADRAEAGIEEAMKIGIPAIDAAIGGIARGEVIILAARPSEGKSMVVMQWLDLASAKGHSGMIISEEMAARLIARRALTYLTDIPDDQWKAEIKRVRFDINEHFAERKEIYIAQHCSTAENAVKMIDEYVAKEGVSIVAVDYLQLLKSEGSGRYEQVTNASILLKQCAERNDIALLLLSQLSREIDKRPDKIPKLSDIRDSGQIEQDADVVLFLQWPWKSCPTYEHPEEYLVYVGKNRNRGINEAILNLTIRPSRQRIEQPAQSNVIYREDDVDKFARDWT